MVFLSSGDASSAASNYNQTVSSFAELLQALFKLANKQKEDEQNEPRKDEPEGLTEDQEKLLEDYQKGLDRESLDDFDQRLNASPGRAETGGSLALSPTSQITTSHKDGSIQTARGGTLSETARQYSFNRDKDGSIQIAKVSGEKLVDFHPQSGLKVHEGCSKRDQANLIPAIAGVHVANELLKSQESQNQISVGIFSTLQKAQQQEQVSGKQYSFIRDKDGSIEIARVSGEKLVTFSPKSGMKTHPGFGKQDQEAFVRMFSTLQKAQQQQAVSTQKTGNATPGAGKPANKGAKPIEAGGRSR